MKKKILKLAFHGKSGTGKDTSVDYILKKVEGIKLSFAKPIYDLMYMSQDKLGFKRNKDRTFLQFIGTWAKLQNLDIWIDKMKESIKKNEENEGKNILVSDLRYKQEYKFLKNNGFTMIKLTRKNYKNDTINNKEKKHKSEIDLDDYGDDKWDHIIDNDETLDFLYTRLDAIIFSIFFSNV